MVDYMRRNQIQIIGYFPGSAVNVDEYGQYTTFCRLQ